MKRFLLIFIGLVLAFSFSYASGNEREYKWLIRELDIDTIAMRAKSSEEFWNVVWKKNERLYKFYKAFDKKKSSAIKANDEVNRSLSISASYYNSFDIEADNSDSLLIGLLEDLGALKLNPITKLYVVYDTEANAFATPDGRIYLFTGLFVDGMSYPHILGICAHEFAHFLLQHSKVEVYETIKQEKTNKIIAGVSAAVQAGAAMYSATNGVESDWNAINQNIHGMFDAVALRSQKFRYRYSRKQEIEADIIACKFLEYMGYGGDKYIEALKLIEDPLLESLYTDDSNHPTTSFRIGLLEYMLNHPEIVRDEPKAVFE
ncbi:MAG: M48 family metalloprotease [Bacteroidales bacterium]|nr:M48 family metalloprotease [Bacteroidales bacterium]